MIESPLSPALKLSERTVASKSNTLESYMCGEIHLEARVWCGRVDSIDSTIGFAQFDTGTGATFPKAID